MTREQVLKHASGRGGLLHSPKRWTSETRLNVMQLYFEGALRAAWVDVQGPDGETFRKQAWFPVTVEAFTDEESKR